MEAGLDGALHPSEDGVVGLHHPFFPFLEVRGEGRRGAVEHEQVAVHTLLVVVVMVVVGG